MVVGVTNFNTAKTHWWLTFHLGCGLGPWRQIFECVRIVRSVGHSARALHADDALASLHHSYGAAQCDVSIIRCCFVLLKIAECRHQQLCSDVIITGHINQSVYPSPPPTANPPTVHSHI